MAIKKSELYSSLWAGCDALRGGMDASQYKDYVLVLLFIKYVSDKFAGQPFASITVPKGASFADLVALKGKPDIGDQINKRIVAPLESANGLSFGGVDFNDATKLGSGKELVERLSDLIAIFETPALNFSRNRADGDDLLGDAYEYLMRHFATESGKSKGQFYTPAEVSRIIAQVLGIRHASTTNKTTVYDPTCGSGSLLLKIGDEAARGKKVRVTLYGQEKDNATAGLARMNMILHDYAGAVIKQGNTLANPLFTNGDALDTYDYVVANPPFSDKRWSTGLHPDEGGQPGADGSVSGRNYHRFDGYGIPPAKQGDYAYLLHILKSLKSTGRGACILPHGVLFRGNAEGAIRRNLVQRGVIQAIIGLPANLFYGTGIPACLVLLDKAGAPSRKGIFMIDASKGFRKDGPKNRLREQDAHRIVDTFERQADVPGYSRLVPVTEIASAKNDYNLNLPRYIDSTEPEDLQDIDAHLRGGIPNRDLDGLNPYWKIMPGLRAAVFAQVVAEVAPLPNDMHAEYGQTHFATPEHVGEWPAEFAIITGYATTGEQWTAEQNKEADAALEAELRGKTPEIHRVTGYSPTTLHAEPGWAAALSWAEACAIGRRFKQDAIYFVQKGVLHVSFCDQRRKLIPIGPFLPRLHLSSGSPAVRPGYSALKLPLAEVKPTIFGHLEFTAFTTAATKHFKKWRGATEPALKALAKDAHPKALIETISEDLLAAFEKAPLLDAYDVYQHLMDYWTETMQDDVYLIAGDGWREAAQPRLIVEDKKAKTKTRPDLIVGKQKYQCELIPPALVIAKYFPQEQAAIDTLTAEVESLAAQLTELEEEHSAEDAVFGSLEKITRATVTAALSDLGGAGAPRGLSEKSASSHSTGRAHRPGAPSSDDRILAVAESQFPYDDTNNSESAIPAHWLDLHARLTEQKSTLRDAEEALAQQALAKFQKLTVDEIKTLVVDDKWLATLAAAVQGELDRVSQTLTGRIRQLAERYATPLPQLTDEVATLAARVDGHLKKMGAVWK